MTQVHPAGSPAPASSLPAGRIGFFYGTLMVPGIVKDKTGTIDHLHFSPAILPNFSRRKVYGQDYPGVIPQAGSTCLGTVVHGLTDRDIVALDEFEGDEYTREHHMVAAIPAGQVDIETGAKPELVRAVLEEAKNLGSGKPTRFQWHDAEIYVYTFGDEYLEDAEWSYAEFRRDKMGAWLRGKRYD